jgi:hypothetical protein
MSKRRPCGDAYDREEVTATDIMVACQTLLLAGFTAEVTAIMASMMKNDKDTRAFAEEEMIRLGIKP